MASFDNLSSLRIRNNFSFEGISINVADSGIDTVKYSKVYFLVQYLQSGSAVIDFNIGESDAGGGPYTEVDQSSLIGSYSDFLLEEGADVPTLDVDLPTIGVFGTKRYLSLNWTTSAIGTFQVVVTTIGYLKVKPTDA